ncbi:MAG: histidine phosphatase family protein [Lachnospiraceae bacterium]|nr:histidine phosphatase family protein [Lachnospiraceae bacterium]
MAKYYLIRHGEADYEGLSEKGFFGFGRDFAPLSELGIAQAEETARDERLKNADIIVSSPYTRALQTAAIISRETGLKIKVETDLHEWIPDKRNRYATTEEAIALYEEFTANHGEYPKDREYSWETMGEMRERMRKVKDKYAGYNKVIFVGHSMALSALKPTLNMKPAEIVEMD